MTQDERFEELWVLLTGRWFENPPTHREKLLASEFWKQSEIQAVAAERAKLGADAQSVAAAFERKGVAAERARVLGIVDERLSEFDTYAPAEWAQRVHEIRAAIAAEEGE